MKNEETLVKLEEDFSYKFGSNVDVRGRASSTHGDGEGVVCGVFLFTWEYITIGFTQSGMSMGSDDFWYLIQGTSKIEIIFNKVKSQDVNRD